MKKIIIRIKGYIMDRKIERKERAMEEKRQAIAEMYAYAVPTLTVAACTAMALSGQFSFM